MLWSLAFVEQVLSSCCQTALNSWAGIPLERLDQWIVVKVGYQDLRYPAFGAKISIMFSPTLFRGFSSYRPASTLVRRIVVSF